MNPETEQSAVADRPGPLTGRMVAVTRPEPRADELSRRLRDLGARVLECPAIRLRDPDDLGPLRRAASDLEDGAYDWLVFTSPAGVGQLCRFLAEGTPRTVRGEGGAAGRAVQVAAIGSSTAASAREAGFRVAVVPEDFRAEALAEEILRAAGPAGESESAAPLSGIRILLPRAAEAREVLPRRLQAAGARVDEVPAYVAVRPDDREMEELRQAVAGGRVDWLTFTASSIVRSYVDRVGTDTGGARVAAIGPITAGTARSLGLRVDAVAEEYTTEGLVRSLLRAEGSLRPGEAG